MNKTNIFIISVILISAGAYMTLEGRGDSNTEYPLSGEIAFDGTEFEPKEVTIKLGGIITFTNNSNKDFWPASNLHPTHNIYGEFDPRKPISPSESFTFTFEKSGVWGFHDHLTPTAKGTIIVAANKNFKNYRNTIREADKRCEDPDVTKLQCWEGMVDATVAEKDLTSALELIANLYSTEPDFRVECHGFVHRLGENAYQKFANEQSIKLSPKTAYCAYGFYHGFMETLLHTSGNPQEARDFCDYADRELRTQTTDAGGACYHGIGHGAVDGSDPTAWGDPIKMIEPGMEICEGVAIEEHPLYRCVTGVFNAIEILSIDSQYKLFDLQRDPFSLCHNQIYAYKEPCYTNMLPAVMRNYNGDFYKIARAIETEVREDENYKIRNMVIMGLFHEPIRIRSNNPNANFDDFIEMCRTLNEKSRIPCIKGLSGGHMKYGEPQKEYIKSLEFCANKLLREDESETCYSLVVGILRIWYTEQKTREICLSVPEKYKDYCPVKI